MSEIARWSTTAANNTFASPFGAQGSYAVSTVDNWERQLQASVKESYIDSEWLDYDSTYIPAFVSTTSFTIPADVTTLFTPFRKFKLYGSTFGTHCGVVLTSTFSSPNTTIVCKMDEGTALTSNISTGYLLLSIHSTQIPSVTHDPSGATYPYLFGGPALSSWVTAPKNIIQGGNFTSNPWQRGISFLSIPSGSDRYTADRWVYHSEGTAVVRIDRSGIDGPSTAQSGIVPQFVATTTVTTADTSIGASEYAYIGTRIEGYDYQQIAQMPFTLGFWVNAFKTGTYCVAFQNSGLDRSYIAEYTINSAATWEYKQITVTAPPSAGTWNYSNGVGLRVYFVLAAGSTYQGTANTWNSANQLSTSSQVNALDSTNNYLRLSLVSIIRGRGTFDWSQPLNSENLNAYKRYYMKSFSNGVYAGDISQLGEYLGIGTGSSPVGISVRTGIDMVSIPTVTLYSPGTGTAGFARNLSVPGDLAATASQIGTSGFLLSTTLSPAVGTNVAFHFVADSPL